MPTFFSSSIVSNTLWILTLEGTRRLYKQAVGCTTEESVSQMCTWKKIWKCQIPIEVSIQTPDRQMAIRIEGTKKGVTIKIMNEDYAWPIYLEDRKAIHGKQIVALLQIFDEIELEGAVFRFA